MLDGLTLTVSGTPYRPVRLLGLAVLTGAAAGVGGAVLTLVLHTVQHLLFGYSQGTFLTGLEHAPPWRVVGGAVLGGLLVGIGWALLRRRVTVVKAGEALAHPDRRMPLPRTVLDSTLQICAVASGASVGREGAPRQVGAAMGGWLGRDLDHHCRRVLLAAGAGAGLSSVYRVPISGVIFALIAFGAAVGVWELAAFTLSSIVGTVVALPVVGIHSIYSLPHLSLSMTQAGWLVGWTVLAGPLCAASAIALHRLCRSGMSHQAGLHRLPFAVAGAIGLVGVAAVWWPELAGNGKGIVELALRAPQAGSQVLGAALTFAVVAVIKMIGTAVCLRAGIVGGLLTPALSVGAALGSAVALGVTAAGSPQPVAAWALVGAAGVLAVSHRSAWFAVALTWELTMAPWWVLAAMVGSAALGRRCAVRVGHG